MALFILQPGIEPLGQFDFLDGDLSTVRGGMIGTWGAVTRNSSTDLSMADANDGYVSSSVSESSNAQTRPVLQLADTTGDDNKAMYLLDEGISKYGTLFGSVISMFDSTGTALGPHTDYAAGKVTAWDKPGLYAVTFESCYSDKNVTNGALEAGQDTPAPGDLLYRHRTTGKITRAANSTANNKIGVYVEHSSGGSMVTTPARLVGASEVFDRVVFDYLGFGYNM